jgi:hypothetical protein
MLLLQVQQLLAVAGAGVVEAVVGAVATGAEAVPAVAVAVAAATGVVVVGGEAAGAREGSSVRNVRMLVQVAAGYQTC